MNVVAQSIIVSSELDTTQGYIGDVVNWTVLVDNAENRRIQFPELLLQDDTVEAKNSLMFTITFVPFGSVKTPGLTTK